MTLLAPDTLGQYVSTILLDTDSPYDAHSEIEVDYTVQGVEILSPDPGEQWCNAHTETISWKFFPTDIDSVRLYLSDDDGSNYSHFHTSMGAATSYNWFLPSYWTDSARVKVEAYDDGYPLTGESGRIVMRGNGDVNCSHGIDITDISYLVNYLFNSGPAPCIAGAGDVDGDSDCDSLDLEYLIDYAFYGGPPPVCFVTKAVRDVTTK